MAIPKEIVTPHCAFDLAQNSVHRPDGSRTFINEPTLFNDGQIKIATLNNAVYDWAQASALSLLKSYPESSLTLTVFLENLAFFNITETLSWTQDEDGYFTQLNTHTVFECGLRYVPSPANLFGMGGSDMSRLGGATGVDKVELGLIEGSHPNKARLAVDKIRYTFAAKHFAKSQSEMVSLCAGLFDLLGFDVHLKVQKNGQTLCHEKLHLNIKATLPTLPQQDMQRIHCQVQKSDSNLMALHLQVPFHFTKTVTPIRFFAEADFTACALHADDFLSWHIDKHQLSYLYQPLSEREKVHLVNLLFPSGYENDSSSFIQMLVHNFLEYNASGRKLYGRIIEAFALGHLDLLTFWLEVELGKKTSVLPFYTSADIRHLHLPKPLLFLHQKNISLPQRLAMLSFYLRFHTGAANYTVNLTHPSADRLEDLDEVFLEPVPIGLMVIS